MTQQAGSAPTTFLTQEAHDRLAAELDELKTTGRERASQAIGIAREHGDIRENADYDAAKNEQGMMEARIRQLESILRSAVIADTAETGTATPGTVVTIELAGDEETYFLGSREESVPGMDVLSVKSPLGQALIGRSPGESFTYVTPSGRELQARLVSVEPRR